MKRIAVLLFVILGIKTVGYSQDFALKTNGLYWATTTLNLGVEKAISNQVTLEADVAYNPWTFREDKKMHLLLGAARNEILAVRKVRRTFCRYPPAWCSILRRFWQQALRWLLGWRRRNIRLRLDFIPSLEPGGSHRYGIRSPLVQAKP